MSSRPAVNLWGKCTYPLVVLTSSKETYLMRAAIIRHLEMKLYGRILCEKGGKSITGSSHQVSLFRKLTSSYELAAITAKAGQKNPFNLLLDGCTALLLPVNCPGRLTDIPAVHEFKLGLNITDAGIT